MTDFGPDRIDRSPCTAVRLMVTVLPARLAKLCDKPKVEVAVQSNPVTWRRDAISTASARPR